jgi:4-amino-4-deoxy-L-arabinose transferase-like glycosyltransferase
MSEFIHEAGWGIWPVLLFGGVTLGLAAYFAFRPRRSLLALVVGFGVGTVIAGCLGALTGIQNSVYHIQELDAAQRWIFLIGLRESLNNLVLAFVIVCLACLAATVGGYRMERSRELDSLQMARASSPPR